MASQLYMRDDVRAKLERLAAHDQRPLIDELNVICDEAMERRGIDLAADSSGPDNDESAERRAKTFQNQSA